MAKVQVDALNALTREKAQAATEKHQGVMEGQGSRRLDIAKDIADIKRGSYEFQKKKWGEGASGRQALEDLHRSQAKAAEAEPGNKAFSQAMQAAANLPAATTWQDSGGYWRVAGRFGGG